MYSVPSVNVTLIINGLHHMKTLSDVTLKIIVALHSTSCGSFCSLNLVYSFILCNYIFVSNCCYFHTRALRHIRPDSPTPWLSPLPHLSCSRVLITQMHSSMALWPATFISFSVHKILCLASFYLITSDGKIDPNRFARPNRFESIHTTES